MVVAALFVTHELQIGLVEAVVVPVVCKELTHIPQVESFGPVAEGILASSYRWHSDHLLGFRIELRHGRAFATIALYTVDEIALALQLLELVFSRFDFVWIPRIPDGLGITRLVHHGKGVLLLDDCFHFLAPIVDARKFLGMTWEFECGYTS